MSKNAKFERNLLKTIEGMAPQSRQIFMTFVFCVQAYGQPSPSRVGAMAPITHMRWVRLNGGHKTPTLQPMRTPPPHGTDTNKVRLQMHYPSQITTRDGGEQNTHRKQKTKKKMTSLGPGSVVKRGGGGGVVGGKKRGQIGKISASEASPAMALSHRQTRQYIFFFCPRQCGAWTQAKNETRAVLPQGFP